MIRSIKHILAILPLMLLAACSAPEDRFVPAGDDFAPKRGILIEEFTGQGCVNCPKAHSLLKDIEKQFGAADIIAVGIHIPQFGADAPDGFVTPESRYYGRDAESAPSAIINRRNGVVNTDQWLRLIIEDIATAPQVAFSDFVATAADGKLQVSLNVTSDKPLTGRLQLWLVEDDIKAVQMLPDNQIDMEYNHHAVLRCALNGLDGEEYVFPATAVLNDFTLPSYVNPANLRVVAFVFTQSQGVLNAVQTHVTNL